MTRTDELEDLLRETLAQQAASVAAPDAPFDASRPAQVDVLEPTSRDQRQSRPAWIAIATAAAVVVASLWWVRTSDPGRSTPDRSLAPGASAPAPSIPPVTTERAPTPPTAHGELVAQALPAGYELWHVELPFHSTDRPIRRTSQLIEAPASGAMILFDFQVASPGDGKPSGTPVVVRGQAGAMRVGGGSDPFLTSPEGNFTISWSERGASVRAIVRGMGQAEAVAVLEQEQWAHPEDAVSGFAEPRAPGWRTFPVPPVAWLPSGAAYPYLSAYYARSAPRPSLLEIGVTTATSIPLVQYLDDVFAGERRPDGSYLVYESHPAYPGGLANGRLAQVWPDGRRVQVLAVDPAPRDQATLEAIAASAVEVDATQVAALHRDVVAKRDASPAPPPTVLSAIAPS